MLAIADSEELTYQMAYDLIEADEQKARLAGVQPSAAVPDSRRIRLDDPDFLTKMLRAQGLA